MVFVFEIKVENKFLVFVLELKLKSLHTFRLPNVL